MKNSDNSNNKTLHDIVVVGAGPVGLFTVFEAGLLGLKCHLIDNLDRVGGQCTELYPDKPIYDIPGVPSQSAQEHVDALMHQISPFNPTFSLSTRVESVADISEPTDPSTKWRVQTNEGEIFETPNLFIAAGAGAFEPRKPQTPTDPDKYLNKGITYAVRSKVMYENADITIFGGGDSALDWAVELAEKANSLTLVHRRNAFRGAQATEQKMRELVDKGTINLMIPYSIADVAGDGKLESVSLLNFDTKQEVNLPCDQAIFLFGLNKKLGPVLDWKLDLDAKQKKIKVNTENFMTNREGIFAIGDINDYPGKLDLILCGFHETTLAVQEAFRRVNPGERVPFSYTTSNPKLQERLGVR